MCTYYVTTARGRATGQLGNWATGCRLTEPQLAASAQPSAVANAGKGSPTAARAISAAAPADRKYTPWASDAACMAATSTSRGGIPWLTASAAAPASCPVIQHCGIWRMKPWEFLSQETCRPLEQVADLAAARHDGGKRLGLAEIGRAHV